MKKFIAILTTISILCSCITSAFADDVFLADSGERNILSEAEEVSAEVQITGEDNGNDTEINPMVLNEAAVNAGSMQLAAAYDISGYDEGVTVEADDSSPTGYTATFVYRYAMTTTPPSLVLYSDCFMLFTLDEGTDHPYEPEEYAPGMYPGGGSGTYTIYRELEYTGNDLWTVRIPLSSGAYVYNYQITDENGATTNRLDDPANPTLINTATGIKSLSSMVYVPYNADKQGTGEWKDRSVELPRTDGQTGAVETVAYTGADGDTRGLAIYLPYGYDPDRTEPYKVLYMTHGNSGDTRGNELRWMNEGCAANITDNLIADGKIEPFVVVTMNNQDFGWNYARIENDQFNYIMPFVEANYNVSDQPEGRAYAGLSMGGLTTNRMYFNHADEFDYFGIWSYACTGTELNNINQYDNLDSPALMLGAGMWDFGLAPVNGLAAKLDEIGIENDNIIVPGAHDWEVWQLLYASFAENYLWKAKEANAEYEEGVFVEADEASPTGYTVTFVYRDDTAQKVEVYSNCFNLFKISDVDLETYQLLEGNSYALDAFEPGMHASNGAIGVDSEIEYYFELEPIYNTGYWTTSLPLPSGAFIYNYQITDAGGNVTRRLDDPANPTMVNPRTGLKSLSSIFYVPYNEAKMGTGDWSDYSVELPRSDGQTGTLDFVMYEDKYYTYAATDEYTDSRPLVVYLPYGYDADREEPYKVLYLSHGYSSDRYGSELRWMNEGDVPNIMDNLVAEGEVEPFVIVTMDNNGTGRSWNLPVIMADLVEELMPYVEANYNVYDTPEGRGFAGFSMGGLTTTNVYFNHADKFGYFGIFGGSAATITDLSSYENLNMPKLVLGGGMWDFGMRTASMGVKHLMKTLDGAGIGYDTLLVPGGHDWNTGQQLFTGFARDYLWKSDESDDGIDYSGYDKGVTVEADENSPTGYYATFVYEDTTAAAAKVELYSDCFYHFTLEDGFSNPYSPENYKAGMYPAGGSGDTTCYVVMKKLGNDLWGARVPLSSGAFVYNFRITNPDGSTTSRLDDPNNPTLTNTATGISSLSSMVYIPYNSKTMGTGDWLDRSLELPRTDGRKGIVETVAYTGASRDTRGLAVYLPYGYDANRAKPYKVLYMSHGNSGDARGNELRWMNEGCVANITDNLIAAGKIEPFVVVTMNNQDFAWDYAKIENEQFNYIMPFVEASYNVSGKPADRAFAGLSAGGMTTNRMYFNHADEFDYFGIWSYACIGTELNNIDQYDNLDSPTLMLGAGIWDFGLAPVNGLADKLDGIGIAYDNIIVPGAHDWEVWQLLYAVFAQDYLWQNEGGDDDPSDGPGTGTKGGSGSGRGTSVISGARIGISGKSSDSPAAAASSPIQNIGTGIGRGFSDVPATYWGYAAIAYLLDNGIVSGYEDGTFRPSAEITRSEFITILVNVMGWSGATSAQLEAAAAHFADWSSIPAWAREFWALAYANDLVTGSLANGLYYTDAGRSISRQEACVLLSKLPGEGTEDVIFNDAGQIASWAAESVRKCAANGLVSGYPDNTFKPANPITRAESAAILYAYLTR